MPVKHLFATGFLFVFAFSTVLVNEGFADITYEVTPYSGFSEPSWSVDGGTITTDGTIGEITDANILSWAIEFTTGSGSHTLSSANSSMNFVDEIAGLTASSTEINMVANPTNSGQELLQFNGNSGILSLSYDQSDLDSGGGIFITDQNASPTFASKSFGASQDYQVAAVAPIPEPSGAILVIGLAGIAAVRRRR